MNKWYELTPLDTLFFRGNIPLEAGLPSEDAVFPPPVTVLQGAFRTEYLKQKKISFEDYKNNKAAQEVYDAIGKPGSSCPFDITAVLLKKGEEKYIPAPAHWYVACGDKENGFTGETIKTAKVKKQSMEKFKAVVSSGDAAVVSTGKDAVPLAGKWVRLSLLNSNELIIKKGDILKTDDFYDLEERLGIGLDYTKHTKPGMLYTAKHIRLRQDVTVLVGIDRDIGLAGKGAVNIGGEQRVCMYQAIDDVKMPSGKEEVYMSLVPLEMDDEILKNVLSSSKPMITAGWDMAKGFHKPSASWLPAGAVFTEKINENLVPLAQ